MRKNLFFFSIIAFVLLCATGCYIDYSDGSKDKAGNQIVHTIGNKVYKGEYVEKIEDNEYSVYVTVYVNEDRIKEVVIDEEKSNMVTDRKIWKDCPKSYNALLRKYVASFEGKKVDSIKSYNHEEAKKHEKLDKIAGATVTSDRILKAVQNALNKI